MDISDFPTRHPYGLGLWQNHIERILAGWVGELTVPIRYGTEVTGFAQDDDGRRRRRCPTAGRYGRSISSGATEDAAWSGKRPASSSPAGIATTSSLLAEVEMAEEPELGIRRTPSGMHALGKVEYEIKDGEVVYKRGERSGSC